MSACPDVNRKKNVWSACPGVNRKICSVCPDVKKVCFASSDVNRKMSDLTIQMLTENCLSVLPVHILIERCLFCLPTCYINRNMSVLPVHTLTENCPPVHVLTENCMNRKLSVCSHVETNMSVFFSVHMLTENCLSLLSVHVLTERYLFCLSTCYQGRWDQLKLV